MRRKLTGREAAVDIASQRMKLLYWMAVDAARRGDYELARKYIELALRIARRLRVPKPTPLRRGICPHCLAPLVPGVTARVRVVSRGRHVRVTYTCLLCGYMTRLEFRKVRSRAPKQGAKEAEGAGAAGAS